MAEKGTSVEQLFLDNVNVEQVFHLMDRIDYLFLLKFHLLSRFT